MPELAELTTTLLALPIDQRIHLAQELWASVHEHIDSHAIDSETLDEAERRDAEMESGEVEALSHEEVMEAARKALKCS